MLCFSKWGNLSNHYSERVGKQDVMGNINPDMSTPVCLIRGIPEKWRITTKMETQLKKDGGELILGEHLFLWEVFILINFCSVIFSKKINLSHILRNYSVHSKKSPTGPTEWTPEYLIALATFWWIHGMFSSSDSMRQVASLEDMPWFHDPTPTTLKPLHRLAPVVA